ncbi:MAG: hypothetical protein K2X34_08250 [Hyphomonadaceae bacterium]|nr:hypothetical protein [Hyphomonadaceae bacterium]
MATKKPTLHIAAMLALAFSLLLLTSQVSFAHRGEEHPPQAAQADAAQAGAEQTAPEHDMGAMQPGEMTWPTAESMGGMDHDARPTTLSGRIIRWLGVWHPAVIHFPIALLLTVGFLEAAAAIRRKPIYAASNKILLAVATLGAFAAAPLGWANAGLPAPDDESALVLHRWIGTAIPFLILLVWWMKKPAEEAAVRLGGRLYEITLALTVLVILGQAYLGAEVTHGSGHLAF